MKLEDLEYFPGVPDTVISDIDNNGVSELLTLVSPRGLLGQSELRLYQYDGSSLELIYNTAVLGRSQLGLQDVDGDGKQEIIIYSADLCFGLNPSTAIEIIDDNLESLSAFTVDGCIFSVPSISGADPKNNLIALDDSESNVSQFLEIDIEGNIIWESSPFLGRLNKDSLTFFEDDVYLSRKAAVFTTGFYTF